MTNPSTINENGSTLKGQSSHNKGNTSSTATKGSLQSSVRSIEPPTLPVVNVGQTLTESLSDAFGRGLGGVEIEEKQDRVTKR